MNVHHVHQNNENSFNRCSHPSCNVTKERLKKYCLLRSKENKVVEKFEIAARLHDTISKRRQSIAVTHAHPTFPTNFQHADEQLSRQRRFSTPNKRKMSHLRYSMHSPTALHTLQELNSDELLTPIQNGRHETSITPTPQGSSPIFMRRKISSSLTNLHHLNVDELNNSLHLLHEEAEIYLQRSRSNSSYRVSDFIRDPPHWQTHYLEMTDSAEDLTTLQRIRRYDEESEDSRPRTFSNAEMIRYSRDIVDEIWKSGTQTYTHKYCWTKTPAHIAATEKLALRRELMNNLDDDIQKVNRLIRTMTCTS